jgi:hypothetical protein
VSRCPLLTTLHIREQKNLLELLAVLVESPHHRIQLRHLKATERYAFRHRYVRDQAKKLIKMM